MLYGRNAKLEGLRDEHTHSTVRPGQYPALSRRRAQAGNENAGPLASAPTLEPGSDHVWYFAFGSNMNPKVLTGRRGVKPVSSFPCSVPRFTMGFHCGGASTVEPFERALPLGSARQGSTLPLRGPQNRIEAIRSRSRAQQSHWVYGHTVHGVAHLVTKEDWARVQLTEGILPPFTQLLQVGYQVIPVRCVLYDGEWVHADTLSAAPAFLGNPWTSKPSQRYLSILQEGAEYHGVHPDYVALLKRQPTSQLADPDGVFSELLVRYLGF